MGRFRTFLGAALGLVLTLSCSREAPVPRAVRIVFLHHSTGEEIWKGGVPEFFDARKGSGYRITERNYPHSTGGHQRLGRLLPARIFRKLVKDRYPWDNYPYDYWNLWVAHRGEDRDRGEPNLDDLVRDYDVIVFKHCFPVSSIRADDGAPSASSRVKTLANYKLQYEALKKRMHEYPGTIFILWTGAALTEASTTPEEGERARQWTAWVKDTWDEKGDNIYLWDFRELETGGGLYLKPGVGSGPGDAHPAPAFARQVAPLLGQRIVDIIEGRGDASSLTGSAHAER